MGYTPPASLNEFIGQQDVKSNRHEGEPRMKNGYILEVYQTGKLDHREEVETDYANAVIEVEKAKELLNNVGRDVRYLIYKNGEIEDKGFSPAF